MAGRLSSIEHGVSSRVPQGSNLGPLILNIFVNDISEGILSHVFLHAHDLKMHKEVNSIHERDMLQQDIALIVEWARINRMPLNTKKTAIISYSQKFCC